MKPIKIVDGKAMCPECGERLYVEVKMLLWGLKLSFGDEKWDYPEPLVNARFTSNEGIEAIYCANCTFVLTRDAIHSVEVEED